MRKNCYSKFISNYREIKNYNSIKLCKLVCYSLLSVYALALFLSGNINNICSANSSGQYNNKQQQVSISLILPQSFRVPTNELQGEKQQFNKLQQYVALINNIQDELEDEKLRQKYNKLTLQLRDARTQIAGELFYEHVFDYFQPNTKTLLLPLNLDQVSPAHNPSAQSTTGTSSNQNNTSTRTINLTDRPQQLIVSIRPYQLNSGFGSDNVEFASSAPIPVEFVPSNDGRRSFAIVQTDKPIYKPDERVRIRSLVINENMRPITDDEIRLQIKNPHKVIVEEVRFPQQQQQQQQNQDNNKGNNFDQLYLDHSFLFPPEPMLGSWSVHLLHNDPIANDSISFEVREYVLPTFEIEFDSPKYILPDAQNITGAIIAKYHYGKPVQGKAQFKFGYKESLSAKPKFIARSSIKTIDLSTGRVEYKINSSKIQETDWFPAIAGYRFVVEATVTETSTGHREVSQDSQATFITYPFRISFEDSIEDFKPGLSQPLIVHVFEMQTQRTAPEGAKLVAQYYDQDGNVLSSQADNSNPAEQSILDRVAYTDSTGTAIFNIGPIKQDVGKIQVILRWYNDNNNNKQQQQQRTDNNNRQLQFGGNELAIGHHTLIKHDSLQGWISIMNKKSTSLSVGDKFVSDIIIRDAMIRPQDIHYLIVGRGQILAIDSINTTDGLISFYVTESMVPTIRLVLFAKSTFTSSSSNNDNNNNNNNNGFISDSMKINVGHNLDCGLKVDYKSDQDNDKNNNEKLFKPNDKGKLEIRARIGDLVSLIGVDSAVYTLNNRSRIESSRIIQRIKRLDTGCGFGGGKNDLDVFHNAGLMFIKNFPSERSTSSSSYLGSSCLTVLSQLKHLEDIQLGYSRPMFVAATSQSGRSRVLDLAASVRQRLLNSLTSGANANNDFTRTKRRSKRETDVEALVSSYKDSFSRSCCRIGTLEDIPQKRNCSVRSKIVERYMTRSSASSSSDLKCSRIYYECCRIVNERLVLSSAIPFGRFDLHNVGEPTVRGRILGQQESSRDLSSIPNIGHFDRIETQTLIRKDFRETWLFDLVYVSGEESSSSPASINDPDSLIKSTSLDIKLPHSITSWQISAMALNRYQPMCIMAQPLKLTTFQEIFIQLNMPYKVIQGEQIDLMATIFNYSPQNQEVFVYMYGVEDVCSEAEANERSEKKRIRIDKHSSQVVLFPMIPLKIGKYQIKILAITRDSTSDIVERTLSVVSRGKSVTDETTFSLDPMNHQRRSKRAIQTGNLVDEIDSTRGVQRSKVRLTPTRDSEFIVPQTQECIVSAIGDRFGHTVQTTMIDVENLIRLPHGCGEQVMIYLGPTLYTTRYLSSTNKLTGDSRWRAIRYIQSGYKRILNFRKESGAFSAFARREPSIWLSAFIAKMLCQTERTPFIAEEIHVDRNVVNSALKWLIEMQNNETGAWIEMNPVYHREMLGGVLKENALTAFVTVSLHECKHHLQDLVEELEDLPMPPKLVKEFDMAITAAQVIQQNEPTGVIEATDGVNIDSSSAYNSFRHSNLNGLNRLRLATEKAEQLLLTDRYKAHKERNPYVLALTSYALSFSKPQQSIETFNDLMLLAERSQSKNQLYWRGDYGIETAAYALQALIELGPLANQQFLLMNNNNNNNNDAKSSADNQNGLNQWQRGSDAIAIANWLSSRRSFTGAFESTQDTVVALEALSKFAQLEATPDNGLLPPTSIISSTTGLQPSLVCNVTMSNNNRTKRSIVFGNDNAQILQTFKLDSLYVDRIDGEMLDIITSGNGLGTMSVKLKYNVFQEEDELCRFDITSSIEEWRPPRTYLPAQQQNSPIQQQQQQNEQPSKTTTNGDNNETNIEDDYFKTFDKSMLNELNLYDLNNQGAIEVSTPVSNNEKHVLRFRRAPQEHSMLDLSSKNNLQQQQDNSWTSKLVSTLKSNFASWGFISKSTTTTPVSSSSNSYSNNSTNLGKDLDSFKTTQPEASALTKKKTNTSRRSTQTTLVPLIVQPPSGPPAGSHVNPLSKRIDFNENNTTSSITSTNSLSTNNQSIVFEQNQVVSANKLVLLLKVCVNHMSTRKDSEMAVIEVGILSGFKPNEADLKEIINEIGSPAMHFELSADKSIVIIYMKYIPFSGSYCLQFRLIRDSLVYNLQAGYIRAYEYYSPAHSCSNIYTPTRVANLLETKCDSSGQICQCATKSLCPATNKLIDLGEIHSVNLTSARDHLIDLVCSHKYNLVSLVKLKTVRYLESGKIFKLTVKVKSDFKGNLTKIMAQQRRQKSINAIRKQSPILTNLNSNINMETNNNNNTESLNIEERDLNDDDEGTSLDYLTLTIDMDCVRNDPLLLHLAHPNQWKQGGDLMVLFARIENLEKRFYKISSTPKSSSQLARASMSYPRPKPSVFNGITSNDLLIQKQQLDKNQQLNAMFEDAQQLQYSSTLMLDKDSILHDIAYQAKIEPRETINNLILWLELKSRREKWVCPQVN